MPMPLQILAPGGAVFETDQALLVTAPGEAGDLQIEPGHANLLATLRIGPLGVQIQGTNPEKVFAVHGGLLQVTPHRVLVLADAAEAAENIDRDRAEAARRRAQRRTQTRQQHIDLARAQAALKRALLRLTVADNQAGN